MTGALFATLLTLRATLSSPPPASVRPLSPDEQAAMVGTTWREGCPVPLSELRLVSVPHLDPQGHTLAGRLVVHQDHARAVATVFERLHGLGFVVPSVRPAWEFGGDDDAMMRANNTSAFNCRPIGGTSTWSEHAWGHALDLNPLWNPYLHGGKVDPPEGAPFVERDPARPGTITAEGPVVALFREIGWRWGGLWSRAKDYQHFSATGR